MLFEYVTSVTVIPWSIAAARSTWSDPIPAVMASFSSGALPRAASSRSGAVRGDGAERRKVSYDERGAASKNHDSFTALLTGA